MLHFEAVPGGAVDLLKRLCLHPATEGFHLAGGTALALRFGHRISVDLDFFSTDGFQPDVLIGGLGKDFVTDVRSVEPTGVSIFIDRVKVDFVTYRYPLLEHPEVLDGVRMLHLSDTAAMKLSALSNRGAKKDFYDALELVRSFGIEELVCLYERKYPRNDPMILLRSLLYFDDAEEEVDPESLNGWTWEEVKQQLVEAVRGSL